MLRAAPQTQMADISIDNASSAEHMPDNEKLKQWCECALAQQKPDAELSLRIVDEAEMQNLNANYRHQDKSTNVLSFPSELPTELGLALIGDIVVCPQVVEREAQEQNKSSDAHWAHMMIHGTLHLLGYDHINNNDALEMEALEIQLLQSLGYSNPY
jgi:probable rRNA maturation factor